MALLEREDFRYSFFDGVCAQIYGTLTNGVFLTGFALYLGMNELLIGLMAAIPHLVSLFQLPGSYYISMKGRRKAIACRAAGISRLLWLPILAAGFAPLPDTSLNCAAVLALYFLSQAFSSISYVAWFSWTSDLVPDEIRGTFFGTRNMICGAAGIAAVLIFGNLVDLFKAQASFLPLSVAMPVLCAVVFGLIGLCYLNRITESPTSPRPSASWFQELSSPFRERNFRKFLQFTFCWNFSIYLAAPFFSLYYLRDLKYSYSFVAILVTVAAVVDLFAMRIWGRLSDQVKNKAVIRLAGWGVVFLPAMWAAVRPGDVIVPIMLQIISGGFWAGVNLCSSNMLLSISPQNGRVWYISAHSIATGLGAALAPILAGFSMNVLNGRLPDAHCGGVIPLHVIFMISTLLRVASLLLFNRIHEPQETSMRAMIAHLTRVPRLSRSGAIQFLGTFVILKRAARGWK